MDEIRVKITTVAELRAAQETAQNLERILNNTRLSDAAAKEYRATLDALNRSIANNGVQYANEAAQLKQIIQLSKELGVSTTALQQQYNQLQSMSGSAGKPTLFAQMKNDILGVASAVPGVGNLISKVFTAASGPVGLFTAAITEAYVATERFSKTEMLWARLDSQLARSGELFSGNRQKYQALMEKMSDTTIGTSDQQWGSIILRLMQFGRTSDQVGKDVETIRLLAARMNVGIESAAMTYERALNGSFYALQRHGMMIPQHLSQMEKMKFLTGQVAGSQSYWNAVMHTTAGEWDTMETNLGRLTTTLGRHLNESSPMKFIYMGISEAAGGLAKVLGGTMPGAIEGMKNEVASALPTMADFKAHQDQVHDATLRSKNAVENFTVAMEDYKKKITETAAEEKTLIEIQKAAALNRIDVSNMTPEQKTMEKAMIEERFNRREFNVEQGAVGRKSFAVQHDISEIEKNESDALDKARQAQSNVDVAQKTGRQGDISRAETLLSDALVHWKEAADVSAIKIPKLRDELNQLGVDFNKLRLEFAKTEQAKQYKDTAAEREAAVAGALSRLNTNPSMPAGQIGSRRDSFGRQVDATREYGANAASTDIINRHLEAAGITELEQFKTEVPASAHELQIAIFLMLEQKKAMAAKIKFEDAQTKGLNDKMGEAQKELQQINDDLKTTLGPGNKSGYSSGGYGPHIGAGGLSFQYGRATTPYQKSLIPQYAMNRMTVGGQVAEAISRQQAAANAGTPPGLHTSPETPPNLPGNTGAKEVPVGVDAPYPDELDADGKPTGRKRTRANTIARFDSRTKSYLFNERNPDGSMGVDISPSTGKPFTPGTGTTSADPAPATGQETSMGKWESRAWSAAYIGVAVGGASLLKRPARFAGQLPGRALGWMGRKWSGAPAGSSPETVAYFKARNAGMPHAEAAEAMFAPSGAKTAAEAAPSAGKAISEAAGEVPFFGETKLSGGAASAHALKAYESHLIGAGYPPEVARQVASRWTAKGLTKWDASMAKALESDAKDLFGMTKGSGAGTALSVEAKALARTSNVPLGLMKGLVKPIATGVGLMSGDIAEVGATFAGAISGGGPVTESVGDVLLEQSRGGKSWSDWMGVSGAMRRTYPGFMKAAAGMNEADAGLEHMQRRLARADVQKKIKAREAAALAAIPHPGTPFEDDPTGHAQSLSEDFEGWKGIGSTRDLGPEELSKAKGLWRSMNPKAKHAPTGSDLMDMIQGKSKSDVFQHARGAYESIGHPAGQIGGSKGAHDPLTAAAAKDASIAKDSVNAVLGYLKESSVTFAILKAGADANKDQIQQLFKYSKDTRGLK